MGSVTFVTAAAALISVTRMAAERNTGVFRVSMRSKGSESLRWRRTNATRATTPTAMGATTSGLPHPKLDALEKPYSMPPNATVDRRTEGRSRRGSLSSPTLSSKNQLATAMISTRGTIAQNISRQPNASMMAPPATGPTAGPADITMPAMPMAVPRFSGGKTSMGTTATSGSCTPAPAACSTRPAKRTPKLGATAHSTVPAANTASDAKNSLRVENLSIR